MPTQYARLDLALLSAAAQRACPLRETLTSQIRSFIIPAPEANHAVAAAIEEALRCKEEGLRRSILFNLSGHGNYDMQAYLDYFAGELHDQNYSQEELSMALANLPSVANA